MLNRSRKTLVIVLASSIVTCASALVAAATAEETRSAFETTPTGWIDLLAEIGPNLKGWTRGSIPPEAPLREESPWTFGSKAGILHCDGRNLHEWLRFDREFSDFILHVEWRFVPVVEGKTRYNSGLYVRNSADATIWHQAQTGSSSGGFLFGQTLVDGKKTRVDLSKAVKDQRVKPAGEWNTFELTCKGKVVKLWVNGAVTCEWNGCEVPKGFVGLEAEGYRIDFRKVVVKDLK